MDLFEQYKEQLIEKEAPLAARMRPRYLSEFIGQEVIFYHIDRNHNNWKDENLKVIYESCHDYIQMNNQNVIYLRLILRPLLLRRIMARCSIRSLTVLNGN
jgi:hypothetical protein